jgi:uncharacterized protein
MNTSKNSYNFGLSDDILETMMNCIKVFPDIDEVIIFGSRAMGNYKNGSDIDVSIKGNLKDNTTSSLRYLLDNAPGSPYKVDVLDYNKISNLELKKHIDEDGKVFFKKEN